MHARTEQKVIKKKVCFDNENARVSFDNGTPEDVHTHIFANGSEGWARVQMCNKPQMEITSL